MSRINFKTIGKWIGLIIALGFALPILAASIQGRIVHFNPLAIVSTQNDNLSDCIVEGAYQDSFSGRKFAGIDVFSVRRYDVIDERLLREYYWFNIPGKLRTVQLQGITTALLCKSDPNYDPL